MKMNILILEDDQMLRKALSFHLLEAGHTISVAVNGEEALKLVDANRNIDAIICDVMTPVLSGPSFLLSLKKYFPKKLPPVIIITSVKKGDEFLKEIEIPYDYYIAKPVDFDRLSGILKEIVSGKK
jgi:DNA-binding response OmpR family regulator